MYLQWNSPIHCFVNPGYGESNMDDPFPALVLAWPVGSSGCQHYLGAINCTSLFTTVNLYWFTSTPDSFAIKYRDWQKNLHNGCFLFSGRNSVHPNGLTDLFQQGWVNFLYLMILEDNFLLLFNSCSPHKGFNFGNYFSFGEKQFSLFIESPDHDLFLILEIQQF